MRFYAAFSGLRAVALERASCTSNVDGRGVPRVLYGKA